jgi:hypothetical protein
MFKKVYTTIRDSLFKGSIYLFYLSYTPTLVVDSLLNPGKGGFWGAKITPDTPSGFPKLKVEHSFFTKVVQICLILPMFAYALATAIASAVIAFPLAIVATPFYAGYRKFFKKKSDKSDLPPPYNVQPAFVPGSTHQPSAPPFEASHGNGHDLPLVKPVPESKDEGAYSVEEPGSSADSTTALRTELAQQTSNNNNNNISTSSPTGGIMPSVSIMDNGFPAQSAVGMRFEQEFWQQMQEAHGVGSTNYSTYSTGPTNLRAYQQQRAMERDFKERAAELQAAHQRNVQRMERDFNASSATFPGNQKK